MFSRWGAFVYRHRRIVFVVALAVGVLGATFAGRAASVLSAGGWFDPGSESAQVTDRLASEFGEGKGALIALYHGTETSDARGDAFQAEVTSSLSGLTADPDVAGVVGYAQTGDPRFISNDGHAAYVVINLNVTDEASVPLLDRFESEIHQPGSGIELQLGGYAPLTRDSAAQSEQDLVQAETVSLPIAALVLIIVFSSILAAGIPLLVALLAIPTTLALVYVVGQQVELSIYVQNVSTMLGLALAIDYSLFMVSRFREELRRGRTVGAAVEIAVATSGKAVTFSGLAVATGLAGLLAFSSPALRSFGIGGMLTVGASLFFALTFLPALLGMLGPRVNVLSVSTLIDAVRWILRRPPRVTDPRTAVSRWERIANAVMARPVLVLVPTLAVLVLAGIPFLALKQGIPDAFTLPPGLESREAAVALQTEFEAGTTSPIVVLADVTGDPASTANVRRCPPTPGSWPRSTASSGSRARSAASPTRRRASRSRLSSSLPCMPPLSRPGPRRWPGCGIATCTAPRFASMRSARSSHPPRKGRASSPRCARSIPGRASPPASVASPRPAMTSSSRSRPGSRSRSAS